MIRNHFISRFSHEFKEGRRRNIFVSVPIRRLKEKKIAVRAENYEQVFHTGILPGDTAETIWRRFLRHRPA